MGQSLYYRKTLQKRVRRCSVKKVFLEILQNSQKNACARDSYNKHIRTTPVLQNTLFYRTPTVAASELKCILCRASLFSTCYKSEIL